MQSTGGHEADDVIARLSKQAIGAENSTVLVFSVDKDLQALLADPRVHLFHFNDSTEVVERTAESAKLRLGEEPYQITDLRAIRGDKANGFPGRRHRGEGCR